MNPVGPSPARALRRMGRKRRTMKFTVSYSESQIREIDIEAESAEEAERMVLEGDADYGESREIDATVMSVNSVEEIKWHFTFIRRKH